ncbi:MAG: PASTA domain-containing protein [Actinomycetota bacterium]
MAVRLPSFLPRVAVLVIGVLSLTAGLTYAAGSDVSSAPPPAYTVPAAPPPVTVPDVRNQAFVFAKGTLEDAGFSWQVVGGVKGYPANVVVSQSPAAGTRLVQTGAPLITLTLKQVGAYKESGDPEDVSPYESTAVETYDRGPAWPASTTTAAASTTPATTTTTPTTTTTTTTTSAYPETTAKAYPQNRPPAFTVAGGKKEPLDEMPLTDRAQLLATWVDKHPAKSQANVSHWLYQHEWIVAGADLGWWHGEQALQTLITVDRRVQQLWGIGAKSEADAQAALANVRAKSH